MATNSISRTRATNLTGLIDIDALVEANTLRQKQKINTATQKMKVEQYKQDQYREIQKKAKDFSNKYFDVLAGGNLLSSGTYNTTQFTATDSTSNVVSATGSGNSNVTNYSVSVTKLASKANVTYKKDSVVSGTKIDINGEKFILKGKDQSEIAKNLSADLESAGFKIEARYSQLANNGQGGLIIENSSEGAIELNVKMVQKPGSSEATTVSTAGSFSTSIEKSSLKAGNKIKIGDNEFTMSGDTEEDIISNLNSQLSSKNLKVLKNLVTGKIDIQSENTGDSEADKFTAQLIADGKTTDLKVDVDKGYTSEIKLSELSGDTDKGISINGQNFRVTYTDDGSVDLKALNNQLANVGVNASVNGDKLIISSKGTGTSSKFEAGVVSYNSSNDGGNYKEGTNLTASVTEGNNIYEITDGKLPDGTTINGNSITLDGTTFKFTGTTVTFGKDADGKEIVIDKPVTLAGKTDSTELVKKIKDFIKDYNELLGAINIKLYETRDKSYMPLTDDDKEGLSDSEIEKLENKAKEGLLRNDSYLRDFADDMKQTMSTILTSGANKGLSLESFGIKPVENYGAENGLYTVDETALKEAIEKDPNKISEFFSGTNGLMSKLRDNLKDHATGIDSRLAKRAGVENGVTSVNNEMSKDIKERKKLIADMQTALKAKEDALYTRYASLESSLASLQSQQSSLSSYFQ